MGVYESLEAADSNQSVANAKRSRLGGVGRWGTPWCESSGEFEV
jgi:hypothetical protein